MEDRKEQQEEKLTLRAFLSPRNPDLWPLVVTVALFIIVAYFAERYEDFFAEQLGEGAWGMALYAALTMLSVIVPPVNGIVLLPIASAAFGAPSAALLSILGWTAGSMVAFSAARYYGEHVARHFPGMARYSHIERLVSKNHLFWSIVFLKMTFPVDVLSYALGFFTRVRFSLYFWATVVGVTPFAFVFASLGGLSAKTQMLIFAGASLIFLPYLYYMRRKTSEKEN